MVATAEPRVATPPARAISTLPFAVSLVAIAASRLLFLLPGYGTDTDAWKLARAAREIATTGRYMASRFPGYPVQEAACAMLWRGGPAALNGLSALMGLACAILLARLFRRVGSVEGAWAALAFACVPVVWIASVSAMDYLWALAFLLAALECALRGRAAAAGLLLGLATGCRITSAAFVVPLAIVIGAGPRPRARRIASVALLGATVGAACYVPAWLRYGSTFFGFVEPGGHGRSGFEFLASPSGLRIPALFVLGQGTVLVWGVLGLAALAAVAIAAAMRGRAQPAIETVPPGLAAASATWIAIQLLLYLRLPLDEGYLVPALPFVLLLLARVAPRPAFRALAPAFLLSSLLMGVEIDPPKKGLPPPSRSVLARSFPLGTSRLWVDPLRGPVLLDHAQRAQEDRLTRRVIAAWDSLPPNSLLFAGTLVSDLSYFIPQEQQHLRYLDFLPRAELEQRLAAGDPVYYLPDLPARVSRQAGYDLRATGARPLFAGPP